MLNLSVIIITLVLHFSFDWILQPRETAILKQTSLITAFFHALIVTMPFIFWLPYTVEKLIGMTVYMILHALQDRYIYSLKKYLPPSWPDDYKTVFLVAIDQTIHLSLLFYILTLIL